MARIKGRNTRPEIRLRRALWSAGARYRVHYKTPFGRPDIVFVSARLAVFVDGCQWHGCPDHYVRPRSRNDFWAAKLATNVERDIRQTAQLEAAGWQVLRFWEHAVDGDPKNVAAEVVAVLRGSDIPNGLAWRVKSVDVVNPDVDLEARNLVELRHPDLVETVHRVRSTRKWKRRLG